MQRQRVDFAHQCAEGAVDLLVALQGALADKGAADDDRLVMRFQPATVHVAFIGEVQMCGLQCGKCGMDMVDFMRHDGRGGHHGRTIGGVQVSMIECAKNRCYGIVHTNYCNWSYILIGAIPVQDKLRIK